MVVTRQVRDLRNVLDGDDILTVRDRVVIGLMLACGLRRNEVITLTWDDLVAQPSDDGDMITVLSILGKGGKRRTVPVPHALKRDLDAWATWTGRDGVIVRRLGRSLDVQEAGVSSVSVHKIVKKYGTLAGIDDLAAHDLRRTFAQTVYAASGHDIVLVSRLLGHASVKTTERYLSLSTTDATEAVNATTWGMAAD